MADPGRDAITIAPIGYVRSRFSAYAPSDEMRRNPSEIAVLPEFADGLMGLEPGDQILTLFVLHRAVATGYELRLHPGHDPANPIRGVFATRSQYRPTSSPLPWPRSRPSRLIPTPAAPSSQLPSWTPRTVRR